MPGCIYAANAPTTPPELGDRSFWRFLDGFWGWVALRSVRKSSLNPKNHQKMISWWNKTFPSLQIAWNGLRSCFPYPPRWVDMVYQKKSSKKWKIWSKNIFWKKDFFINIFFGNFEKFKRKIIFRNFQIFKQKNPKICFGKNFKKVFRQHFFNVFRWDFFKTMSTHHEGYTKQDFS